MGSVTEWVLRNDVATIAPAAVVERGRRYASEGRCSQLEVGADGVLNARVAGSNGAEYKVVAIAGGTHLIARCSCPIGGQAPCKHVVCAMFTLSAQVVPAAAAAAPAAAHAKGARGAPAAALTLTRAASRNDVYAWAESRGVTHWLSVSVAVVPQLLAVVREDPVDFLRRRMLPVVDFFGADSRWSHIPTRFVDDLVDFLNARAQRVAAWRAEEAARVWPEATHPGLAPYRVELINLHAAMVADGRGREPEARGPVQITLEPWPPALAVRVEPLRALAGLGITTLPLLWSASLARVVFTPGGGPVDLDSGRAELPHAHAVEALEHALALVTAPEHVDLAARLATEIATPPWRRALDQMRAHLSLTAAGPIVRTNEEGELGWRIRATRAELELSPVFVRPKKTGGGLVVKKLALTTLAQQPRRWRHPADGLVLAELEAGDPRCHHRAVQHLVGHPRVFIDPNTDSTATVRRTTLVQAAREAPDGVQLGFELDDVFLPLPDLRALIRSARHGVAVEADAAIGVVRVIDVPPEAEALAATWAELGDRLPPEAVPELIGYLTEASEYARVRVPDALTGEPVDGSTAPILQLEAPADGAVSARLVVRPLPERASEAPGTGPERLLARRGEAVVHTQRDFAAEVEAATEVAEMLGLRPHEEGLRFAWGIDAVDDVLDIIGRARAAELPVEWGGEERFQLGRAISGADLAVRAESGKGRDWFGLAGEAQVDGGTVSLAEILRALRERRRYVRIDDGRWATLDAELRRRLEAIAATAAGHDRVSVLAAPIVAELADAGVSLTGTGLWLERMARVNAAATLEIPLPEGLTAELRDYQREGFTWLARLAHWSTGACLADDMGLGKTVQALALLLRRQHEGPQLVVAPTSLGFNWERESARFAPSLRLSLFRGAQHQTLLAGNLGPGDVVVTSYDLVARYASTLGERRWTTLVLDEAQAIKNPETRRARAVFGLDAGFVLALTGTPIENRTGEIWSLFRAVAPGLLGGPKAFREHFAVPIERLGRAEAREGLAGLVRPFVLRRLKRDVARELPPRTDVRVDVDLSAAERTLYEEMRSSAATSLAGITEGAGPQQRFQVLQALTRLRQLSCHPRLVDPRSPVRSSKLAVLLELVSELRAEGHRALIFSQFTTLLALVREALDLAGLSWRYLDGQTPAQRRKEEVDAFQAGEGDVFLLSLKAGGTGLNLTAADYVVHLDPWWNPAVEDQATDRAHRIGQDKPVTVYRLVARGTVEEGIMALHDEKRELAEALLAGTDTARSLSVDELAALIRGGRETRGAQEVDDEVDEDAPGI